MIKRVSSFVIIVSVLVIALTLMSCQSSQNLSAEFQDESSLLQIQRSTPEKSRIAELNSDDLITLKNFAENYEPKSTKQQEIPSPPMPDEKVLQAISNLASIQSREHEKYIVLIFLRLIDFILSISNKVTI